MAITIKDNIFREYDIRGKFGDELTLEVAETLARAYARELKKISCKENPSATIGRDVRLSSTSIKDALVKGLTESGINAIDLGFCPTPLQYFSLHALNADGGIMITGSHNPPEYNGFKVSFGKETIHGKKIQEIKAVMREIAGEAPPGRASKKGQVETVDIISMYVDYHTKGFAATLPNKGLKRPLKVVLDAGNGTGGLAAPRLIKSLGCEVIELFCEPDGRFPNHHPDPTVEENMRHLADKVRASNADFGVGYDGDSDRIGVVDEQGSIIWGDQLMVIFAKEILSRKPGSTIVGEVKCSQVMYDEITRLGGKAVMWKTGHSLIKSRMKELHAEMAGEMSGHIFFADRYLGFDDAVYASARLVEIFAAERLKNPGFRFSELLKGLPKTHSTPEIRVDCPDSEKFGVIEKLKTTVKDGAGLKIREIIDIDGLRIIFDKGWALVRASNTQPVLVFRYEAEEAQVLNKLRSFMQENLKAVWPGCPEKL